MWPTVSHGSISTIEGAGKQPTTHKQNGLRAELQARNIISTLKMPHNRPKTDLGFYFDSGHSSWKVRNRIVYFIISFYNCSNKMILAHFIVNRTILIF